MTSRSFFLRLLDSVVPVQYAKLYGISGQSQGGIDAYARLPLDLTREQGTGRHYITLQSRRIKKLSSAGVVNAIDEFLTGDWANRSASFYYATSYDLQNEKFDEAIREQTERLAKLDIEFIPWGIQEVSALLKERPRLVDEFFGRPWVERACGAEAASSLAHRLTRERAGELRLKLSALYRAVFSAHETFGVAGKGAARQEFVVLDVMPRRGQVGATEGSSAEPGATVEQPQGDVETYTHVASRLGARRQSLRSAKQLLEGDSALRVSGTGAVGADEWIAGEKCRLLIGAPGSGKSSLLRFMALDLLSETPQSAAIQRAHGLDLPIWLPFGFLCRHLVRQPKIVI